MKLNLLRITKAILVLMVSASFISMFGTTVYVTNKTPYSFTPTFAQSGKDILAQKNRYQNQAPIPAKTIKHKLTNFDLGDKDTQLIETLSSSDLSNTLSLAQHRGKKGLEYRIDIPGTEGKWTSEKWYYWDNPVEFSWKDKTGTLVPFEVRARSYDDAKNIEYVISAPFNAHITYPEIPATGAGTISILSLNTYLMTKESMKVMDFVTWFVPKLDELEKPGVDIRAQLLPKAIGALGDIDLLVLSEVWDSDARFSLMKGLKSQGYNYATCILASGFMAEWKKIPEIRIFERVEQAHDMIKKFTAVPLKQPWIIDFNDPRFGVDKKYTIGGSGTFPQDVAVFLAISGVGYIGNGGVIIVSKWPIKEVREWIFKESTKADKYAKKGALYAKIDKGGKIYNIIGTHPATKGLINIPSIAKFIEALKIPANEPLFIAGDMNTDLFENKTYQMLNATIPEWIGSKVTSDGEMNALQVGRTKTRTIDFIVYSNAHLMPIRSFVEVRKMTSRVPWSDNKYPLAKEEPMRNVYDLSDHYAIVGVFACY